MTDVRRRIAAVLLVPGLTLALAAPTAAQTGGAEAAPAGGTQATPGSGLLVRPAALLRRTVPISGAVDAADAGRPVRIERLDPVAGWLEVARTSAAADGTFTARWRADASGRHSLRAVVERDGSASAASAPLTAQVAVFRPAMATWYGPGFYRRRTACGIRYTRDLVGVAHRTLPCGTEVEILHRGRTVTVPVVDRGPFTRGRSFDLTRAAADAVGMRATSRIGYLPAP